MTGFSFLIWRKAPLSSQPAFGVQLLRLLTQLELQDVVLTDATQCLTGGHLLTATYVDVGQVAIYGDVAAVAHHDDNGTSEAEHGTDLTIEDAADLSASFSLDVDTLIVESHIMQPLHIILSEVADNAVGTCDRNGQTTAVALEATADAQVLSRCQQ